jgi:hypothetical protein
VIATATSPRRSPQPSSSTAHACSRSAAAPGLTRFLAAHAREVYAFDPKHQSVAEAEASLAEELRRRVQFAVHDAQALDLPRRRFDLTLCGWSL